MISVDLNADLGEGFGAWTMGDDEGLLAVVSSANVACGFHAGDPSTMRRVCTWAAAGRVAIGAHVSYRDLAGFGRRRMEVPAEVLRDDILYQLAALSGLAHTAGTSVRYLKAHGALYNQASEEVGVARAVADAVVAWDPGLPVLCLPGSTMAAVAADAGLPVVAEGYLDRAYDAGGGLVARREPWAVIDDPAVSVARALEMAQQASVTALDGTRVALDVRSLCVHGDSPGALRLAREVREALEDAGVVIAPFVDVVAGSA
jgi:UPF0271 protein